MSKEIHFNSRGRSGNIFFILGKVRYILASQRRIGEYNELWERVQSADDYSKALSIIREYVALVDDDGLF
jgi:hypothetical protein